MIAVSFHRPREREAGPREAGREKEKDEKMPSHTKIETKEMTNDNGNRSRRGRRFSKLPVNGRSSSDTNDDDETSTVLAFTAVVDRRGSAGSRQKQQSCRARSIPMATNEFNPGLTIRSRTSRIGLTRSKETLLFSLSSSSSSSWSSALTSLIRSESCSSGRADDLISLPMKISIVCEEKY